MEKIRKSDFFVHSVPAAEPAIASDYAIHAALIALGYTEYKTVTPDTVSMREKVFRTGFETLYALELTTSPCVIALFDNTAAKEQYRVHLIFRDHGEVVSIPGAASVDICSKRILSPYVELTEAKFEVFPRIMVPHVFRAQAPWYATKLTLAFAAGASYSAWRITK